VKNGLIGMMIGENKEGKMKALIFAMLVLMVGCQEDPAWMIGSEFTTVEQSIIQSAAQEWCEVAGECLEIHQKGTKVVSLVEGGLKENWTGDYSYKTNSNEARIRILNNRGMDGWEHRLYLVARHEFGHALGCDGDWEDDVENVMAHHLNDVEITGKDIGCVSGR